jgi:hypothetical protein
MGFLEYEVDVLDAVGNAAEESVAVEVIQLVGIQDPGQYRPVRLHLICATGGRSPGRADDGSDEIRIYVQGGPDGGGELSEDDICGERLMRLRSHVLQGMREGEVAHVVKEGRAEESLHPLQGEAHVLRLPAHEAADQPPGDVEHAEAVAEARVRGSGIDEVRGSQLLDFAQLLERGKLDDL